MLKADGLDKAVLGVGMRCGKEDILVYSYDKCIKLFMENDKMTYEVVGAWLGEQTPIFVRDLGEDEL